jgi:hypothetical protein
MSAATKGSIYVSTIRLYRKCGQDFCKQYRPVCVSLLHLSAFQVT